MIETRGGDYHRGWIGVDLDGTLAEYHGWKGYYHIGKPIPEMVDRVKEWLKAGVDVRIFTARAGGGDHYIRAVQDWTKRVFGRRLPVTNIKDFAMEELWDDRAVRCHFNRGTLCRCSDCHP